MSVSLDQIWNANYEELAYVLSVFGDKSHYDIARMRYTLTKLYLIHNMLRSDDVRYVINDNFQNVLHNSLECTKSIIDNLQNTSSI